MEDIEKLVKALRCDELDCVDCEWQEKCNGVPGCLIRHAAADALESLRAENEHIRSNCYARDGVQAIIDERDRFKAERDAPKEEPQLLTRKNLYSMNDQCVWVQYEGLGMPALVAYHADDEDGDGVYLTNNLGGRSEFSEILEQGGVVYRTKPKEEPEQ